MPRLREFWAERSWFVVLLSSLAFTAFHYSPEQYYASLFVMSVWGLRLILISWLFTYARMVYSIYGAIILHGLANLFPVFTGMLIYG